MIPHAKVHNALKIVYQKSERNVTYNARYLCDLFNADVYDTFGQYRQAKEWAYSPKSNIYKDFIKNVEETEWAIGLFPDGVDYDHQCIHVPEDCRSSTMHEVIFFTEEFKTIQDWAARVILDPALYVPSLVNILDEETQIFLPLEESFMKELIPSTKIIKELLC